MPTPLAKKLRVSDDATLWLRGAPASIADALGVAHSAKRTRTTAAALIFLHTEDALRSLLETPLPPLTWLAYPKKSSGVPSAFTRDSGFESLFDAGYVLVGSVALDAVWSAVRVRAGNAEEVSKSRALHDAMRTPKRAPAKKPAPPTPADLAAALARSKQASALWSTLSPSHLREYTSWIDSAKKAETRAARIEKAIAMLEEGVRDRNAKYR